jgi:hypothetical protein
MGLELRNLFTLPLVKIRLHREIICKFEFTSRERRFFQLFWASSSINSLKAINFLRGFIESKIYLDHRQWLHIGKARYQSWCTFLNENQSIGGFFQREACYAKNWRLLMFTRRFTDLMNHFGINLNFKNSADINIKIE